LCLSVGRYFQASPANLSCLGLVVGTSVLRALKKCGAVDAGLKWPNDVVMGGCKLAGILIDVRGEASGPLYVVAGIGANYQVNAAMAESIAASGGLAPASLVGFGSADVAGRNRVAAELIAEVQRALEQFEDGDFATFAKEWRDADYLFGREISVVGDQETISGVAQGITDDGRLRVKSGETVHHVLTGDVSVRPVD
jgi:BirA family biotin operon repressor/biotin-[acetyl-CoA-carboxylase] ligase